MKSMTRLGALAAAGALTASLAACERERMEPMSDTADREQPGLGTEQPGTQTTPGEVQAVQGEARDQLQDARGALNEAVQELDQARRELSQQPVPGEARSQVEGSLDEAVKKLRDANEKIDEALGEQREPGQQEIMEEQDNVIEETF